MVDHERDKVSPPMQFMRAGEQSSSARKISTNILHGMRMGDQKADLSRKLTLPPIVQIGMAVFGGGGV